MKRGAWSLLVIAGLASHAAHSEMLGSPANPDLTAIPRQLGVLTMLQEIPLGSGDLEPLDPDSWIYRLYSGPGDQEAYVFVSYSAHHRSGKNGPLHWPDLCLRARGWEIAERSTIKLASGGTAQYLELVRGDEREQALYWGQWSEYRPQASLAPSLADRLGNLPTMLPDAVYVCIEIPGYNTLDRASVAGVAEALSSSIDNLFHN